MVIFLVNHKSFVSVVLDVLSFAGCLSASEGCQQNTVLQPSLPSLCVNEIEDCQFRFFLAALKIILQQFLLVNNSELQLWETSCLPSVI